MSPDGPRFQSASCPICGGEIDPDVQTVEEDLPGVTLERGFCSPLHRQDYLDKYARDDVLSPRERVERDLRNAGMDPAGFDADEDENEEGV